MNKTGDLYLSIYVKVMFAYVVKALLKTLTVINIIVILLWLEKGDFYLVDNTISVTGIDLLLTLSLNLLLLTISILLNVKIMVDVDEFIKDDLYTI